MISVHRQLNQGYILVQIIYDIRVLTRKLTGFSHLFAAPIIILNTRMLTTNLTGLGRMIGRFYNRMVWLLLRRFCLFLPKRGGYQGCWSIYFGLGKLRLSWCRGWTIMCYINRCCEFSTINFSLSTLLKPSFQAHNKTNSRNALADGSHHGFPIALYRLTTCICPKYF